MRLDGNATELLHSPLGWRNDPRTSMHSHVHVFGPRSPPKPYQQEWVRQIIEAQQNRFAPSQSFQQDIFFRLITDPSAHRGKPPFCDNISRFFLFMPLGRCSRRLRHGSQGRQAHLPYASLRPGLRRYRRTGVRAAVRRPPSGLPQGSSQVPGPHPRGAVVHARGSIGVSFRSERLRAISMTAATCSGGDSSAGFSAALIDATGAPGRDPRGGGRAERRSSRRVSEARGSMRRVTKASGFHEAVVLEASSLRLTTSRGSAQALEAPRRVPPRGCESCAG